ncbi:hypothetical protein VNI00_015659 [Paramarasmius palmivorus]|uniref:Amino acid transporter n=1 Tax=Paramarasmius palmivorus TaxID=297713 RepID=A0AAW0BIA2_9AGAR
MFTSFVDSPRFFLDSSLSKMDEVDLRANEGLHKLGYEQQMKRSRNVWHILFMTLAIMAVPFGLSTPIATSLVGGGTCGNDMGLRIGLVINTHYRPFACRNHRKVPHLCRSLLLVFPTRFSEYRLVLSWINGWLTLVGDWMVSLSGTAQLLVAGIGIFQPEWVATAWETYLIFMGITLMSTAVGIFFNGALPALDVLSAVWMALGIIVMLVCLSVKADAGRRSASFALGFFDPSGSGWTPGWSFFIGLLPPGRKLHFPSHHVREAYLSQSIYLFRNMHDMAEEVHDPSVDLPRAMTWQVPIGMLTGIIFLLPILFTLPDIGTLLEVPGGQPLGVMYTLIMGSRGGGFGMWFIIFGVGIFCAISICCAASRATWAFARDKALPFHKVFAHVHSSGTPLNAYLLSTVVQLLIGLIYLGSSTAFNAFVGVAVICLGASNGMAILISLVNGRRDVQDSPYPLGKWGVPLNAIAVLWVLFEIVLFSMPAVVPVTQVTMNYASVVFVGFGVISAVWYMISGRYHYAGPPRLESIDSTIRERENSLSDSGIEDETKKALKHT